MSRVRIGLALGGGSARGLAHIPMLEVFDELGLKPSAIAGCSIGALIGAGYAAGMSAAEIRERAEKLLANRMVAMRYVFGTKKTRLWDILSLRGLGSLHLKGEKLADIALPDHVPRLIEDLSITWERMRKAFASSGVASVAVLAGRAGVCACAVRRAASSTSTMSAMPSI